MLIVDAELYGGGRADLRCEGGRIVQVGYSLHSRPDETVINAQGGALLPGLHDHHLHLYSLAAERSSVPCGPPHVRTREDLASALRGAPSVQADDWVRGSGYHQSVAGLPDRYALDAMVSDRPVRIQHRGGKLWLLNSAAARKLRLDGEPALAGIERDGSGRPTGRLYRLDRWLRRRLGPAAKPDLARVSAHLACFGLTSLTDAGPDNDAATVAHLEQIIAEGGLHQRIHLLGGLRLPVATGELLTTGAFKLLLDEDRLPSLACLTARIRAARRQERAVAVHCVTRSELIFCLSALGETAVFPGDRIEHASVCPDEALPLMRRAGVRIVTQPAFLHSRGDQYALEVPPDEQPLLYRARSFLANGIPVGGSTDAPFGPEDPWLAMRTAVNRRSAGGRVFAPSERLTPEEALHLFTAAMPGDAPPSLTPGSPADLCLLDKPWREARYRLLSDDVRLTICAGRITFHRDERPD